MLSSVFFRPSTHYIDSSRHSKQTKVQYYERGNNAELVVSDPKISEQKTFIVKNAANRAGTTNSKRQSEDRCLIYVKNYLDAFERFPTYLDQLPKKTDVDLVYFHGSNKNEIAQQAKADGSEAFDKFVETDYSYFPGFDGDPEPAAVEDSLPARPSPVVLRSSIIPRPEDEDKY